MLSEILDLQIKKEKREKLCVLVKGTCYQEVVSFVFSQDVKKEMLFHKIQT